MKKLLLSLLASAILATGFASAQVTTNYWKLQSGVLSPANSSWTVNTGGSGATSTFGFITATTTNATSTFAGDVYITGNLRVTGNFFAPVAISSASDIRPSADVTYSLGTGALRWLNTYTQNLFATSSTVTGNGTFGGTLGVTGATTLTGAVNASSTLAVTGATTLFSTLRADGAVTASSTLGVTGATTLHSTLAVSATSTLATTTISSLRLGFTNGSILFSNGSGQITQANSNLFWDASNFRLGINTASPATSLDVATGSIKVVENTLATSTTMTIDWKAGNTQLLRIGTSATSISHTNNTAGANIKVIVCNPSGGSAGAITWSGVTWAGGTTPTQTTTANKCDVWQFLSTNATGTLRIFGSASTNF